MKKILSLLIFTALIFPTAHAQTRYLVKLKNKGGNPFSLANPAAYLSQRAIDRRTRYGIAIDSTDLPVTPSYVTQIRNVPNVTVLNVSKWLNSISIQTTDANAVNTINGFSFVQSVTGLAARVADGNADPSQTQRAKFETNISPLNNTTSRTDQVFSDYYNYGTSSFNEIHLHNGEFLHNIGLRGQGMQIAMLDAGFTNYATLHAFDSMNANGQVLSTWDFVSGNSNVNDHDHGMECLSTIVANIPGQFIGKAPKASFYLFRTEDDPTEYPIEEHNWACGAERADSSGADVISSSLGYTTFDAPLTAASHTYNDMNGNTTMAVIAADLAAKKGMGVFLAVGNDGDATWHYLSTPSDGDSVIAVGAVNSAGVVGSFSSYGPSFDGRVKPDLASVGVSAVVQAPSNTIGVNNGTSFACPNMAGLGTCLWQGFPEFNNMKIRQALWNAGSKASSPDNRVGYGIPNVKQAFVSLLVDYATATGSITNCKTSLNWSTKDISAMRFEIERKAPGQASYAKVADVAALANVVLLANHNYTTTDTLINVQAGTVSYRIRQIVDTAAATFTAAYIDTVNITLGASCITTGVDPVTAGNEKISIIPNPAYTQFTLKVETIAAIPNLDIQLVNMTGRVVLKLNRSKTSGVANFDIPVSRLAKGKYTVSIYDGQRLIASKELLKL
jgi:serine protease AprX